MNVIKPSLRRFEPLPNKDVTLTLKDRLNVSDLKTALAKPTLAERFDDKGRTAQLSYGKDGTVLGPEGQPLITTRRADGTKVYVDPNTNQYYVGDNRLYIRRPDHESVKGPYALPPDAQFTNSHFSTADVRELQSLVNKPTTAPTYIDCGWGRALDAFNDK